MYTFPAENRIRTQSQYQQVFTHKKRIFSPLFILYHVPSDRDAARLGVIVSKRNVRFAVKRNLIKRLVRETFRTRMSAVKGRDFVLIARHTAQAATRNEIHSCLKKLFTQYLGRFGKDCCV